MFNFIKSFDRIAPTLSPWPLDVSKQIDAMIEGVERYDLLPFDYFDNGVYLDSQLSPRDYIGIRQAKQLWDRYGAQTVPFAGQESSIGTYADLFNSKWNTKKWLRMHMLNCPKDDLVRSWTAQNKSFVIKPDDGYGGKGVHTFIYDPESPSCYSTIFGSHISIESLAFMDRQVAEEYIEPLESIGIPDAYEYGSCRLVMFAHKSETRFIAAALKFRHKKTNGVDNYSQWRNAATGISKDGVVFHDAMIKGYGDAEPSVEQMRIKCLPPSLGPSFEMLMLNTKVMLSTIPTHRGMLVAIDAMLTYDEAAQYPGFSILEVNARPGFDLLQVANRQGARPWLKGLL